jgi:dephospho-CoA kinase
VKQARVLRVALTGGIASGKSHVRAEFERLGVPTIDADTLARAAVAPGSAGLDAVVRRFGAGIVDPSGSLNRHALAEIVFADPAARKELEAIVHPAVRQATERFFSSLDPAMYPFAVTDIPLLYEVGRDKDFDSVIVAAVDPATQLQRVMERDGLTESEARQRIAAQLPIADKIARADYVIRTDGSFEETARQVADVWNSLRESWADKTDSHGAAE